MYKLITIACYFGTLPEHFPIFLRSVAMNPTIDFLMITDCKIEKVPSNFKVHSCTFNEMKERLQRLFDFEIVLDRPYKLCDYKPVWGLAFPEYIEGYDFWGYCDIDLIFGDIRHFLPDHVLDKYDKIYKLGHLTYYRNTEEVNERYRLNGGVNYKDAFTTSEIVAFDEIAGMQNIYDKNRFAPYIPRDCADITYRHVRFTLTNFSLPEELIQTNNYDKQVFYWKEGRVFRAFFDDGVIKHEEFNYIHFSKREMALNNAIEIGDNFFITKDGLIPMTREIVLSDIIAHNTVPFIYEWMRGLECKYADTKKVIKYYFGIFRNKVKFQLIDYQIIY